MKKITLLFIFFIQFSAFSQSNKELIQQYLDRNVTKLGLTSQDISDWVIEGEASSTSTNINNYYIKQRYLGTEIYGAVSNVWVKKNEVINIGDRFVKNIAQKINATSPSVTVLNGLNSALTQLQIQNSGTHEIIEQISTKKFKISNGNSLDPIPANLVYYQNLENGQLILAWDFTIDVPGHQHMWNVRIDASNGQLLDQHDMVVKCNFGEKPHTHVLTQNRQLADYHENFYKSNTASMLDVQSGSYRVYPYNVEGPTFGSRQLVTNPHDVTSSPYGWHDTNGVAGAEYTFTRGNNVHAVDDRDGNNIGGATAEGGSALLFDFPYGGDSAQPTTYLNAALTNLFYMNNMMHDVWYKYGFNEANGNFQQNNYGRGGVVTFQGDAVQADAQDGAELSPPNLNNANFSITADGTRPRMQMYLWNAPTTAIQPLTINSPADIAGPRVGFDNAFSPGHVAIPIAPAMIQSDLVLYNDGTPDIGMTDNADACGPAVNAIAINGKIAVIRRSVAEASGGTPCAFAEKVKNAQNAGATGVIIVNNVDGNISMSGADATITIPAISISQVLGEPLIARMKVETVNGKLQLQTAAYVNGDGDFDNGIIAHEYGHGISSRLTGGPTNAGCLQNAEQMGEGWSDWIALMMLAKSTDNGAMAKTIATYASNQPTTGSGIRTYPYSTDMSINPLTFADSNQGTGLQHTRGEFMAAVLWDLTWAYIAKYGFNANLATGTAGNNKVMRLAIDAFKLQPCGPSTVNYRDALIAADQATTGGQDYCMITEVFRRRGMGLNASSGSANNALDQVEDFTAFPAGPNCTFMSVDSFDKSNGIKVYPNPSRGQFNIAINDFSGNVDVEIYDINGRVVYSLKNESFSNEKTIQAGNLQTGLYILKVKGDDFSHSQKIVIE